MDTVLDMMRRLVSQDVAVANAAQASVRLMHLRRQREDLETYLSEQITGRRRYPDRDGLPRSRTGHDRV
jgi:hypothetical protein